MSYPIPDAALAHHTILLGKTRAGKSSVMRGIVERLLDQGKPACIIDPKGDWWGLKSSADGKRAGYSVIIFGGEHADVPLNAHSGAHVAELVATGNRPCIIDLGGWFVGERTRFFIDFASTLFRHTRGPRYLVIDEVHNFAPQGKVHDPDAGKMLHWANRLASEGAGKGITLVSASQRPQKVHKDYLTSHETLIAMRVIHKLDRDAIKDWIDGCPDPAMGREVLVTLASMARGEGWAWSPEAGFGPVRIQFPMFATYDSFAAPTSEAVEKLKGWASVDLDDVRSKLATVVEESKANDPKLLKAEVARLTRELAKKAPPSAAAEWPDQREEVAALNAKVEECLLVIEQLTASAKELERRQSAAVAALGGESVSLPAVAQPHRRPTPAPAPVQRRPAPVREARQSEGDAALTGPQRQMLRSIAWWNAMGHDAPTKAQVAAIAGWRITSGHLKNVAGSLRTAGLIDYPQPGRFSLTDAGRAVAPEPDMSASFHDSLRGTLTGPQRLVFDHLLETGGDLSREDLARAVGWEPTSGHVKNVLGSMKTLEVIDYPVPGRVELAEWVTAA